MHERWQNVEHQVEVDRRMHEATEYHKTKQHHMLNAALSRNRGLTQRVEDLQAQMGAALFPVGLRIATEEKAPFWDQSLMKATDKDVRRSRIIMWPMMAED